VLLCSALLSSALNTAFTTFDKSLRPNELSELIRNVSGKEGCDQDTRREKKARLAIASAAVGAGEPLGEEIARRPRPWRLRRSRDCSRARLRECVSGPQDRSCA
jgi:hypothetical protein